MKFEKFEQTKQKIEKQIDLLKTSRAENRKSKEDLNAEKESLSKTLAALQREIDSIQNKKANREADLVVAETQSAIDEITTEISGCDAKILAISSALDEKKSEIERLTKEFARHFVDQEYPKLLKDLKKERDGTFEQLIECVEKLSEIYQNLSDFRKQHFRLTEDVNENRAVLELDRISTTSWGLTCQSPGGKIDLGLPQNFENFLVKLANISQSENILQV